MAWIQVELSGLESSFASSVNLCQTDAVIRKQADLGKTVLLSSHILSEVQMVTDDVVLIHHGQIIEQGTLEDVLQGTDSLEELFFDLTEEV